MNKLTLEHLPNLPQLETVRRIVRRVWESEEVVAVWVRGSIARGEGDAYSDVDLSVAVKPDAFAMWQNFDRIDEFFDGDCVGNIRLSFGEGGVLHHLVLSNGEMLDFYVQSETQPPSQEPSMLLGCRSETLAEQIRATLSEQAPPEPVPISAEAMEGLLVNFWTNTHKHRKVLHRGLDLLIPTGVNVERSILMRLWYIETTGVDFNPQQGIHGLTKVAKVLQQAMGDKALTVVGRPLSNREEIYRAIEEIRDEVSRVGRKLSEELGFTYPSELEETVRNSWNVFCKL